MENEMTGRAEIIGTIESFVERAAGNAIPECGGIRIYESPLVGFASARDPLYAELKKDSVIGPHHCTPQDWVEKAGTVVAYFLPFTRDVVKSNEGTGMSSREWYLARHHGEVFNDALRDHLVEVLRKKGHQAVAPVRSDRFAMQLTSSNWSERHSAYAAGLGTFCLSYALISERGCAGRYGTVVTDLEIEPTPRRLGLRDNCLHDEEGTCGLCIERCPAGAITAEKKDHAKCLDFILNKVVPEHGPKLNVFVGGCGMCQSKVPCARKIPKKTDL
jgi:epoxyqueuosine reductase QueG